MSLIRVSDLSFAYDGSYDAIFSHASFQIDTNWKLGFVGRNGRGKTTFLKLLMGEFAFEGEISANVDFSYFPFDFANPDQNTQDLIVNLDPRIEAWQIDREFALLELDDSLLERPFSSMSHGEQTKAMLAALFLMEGRFLLIDEPTNHLDAKGRRLVSRYLQSKKSFILVSHDRAFLDGCVDHILSINQTHIEVQRGNFSSWWQNKMRQDSFEIAENAKLEKDIQRLAAASAKTAAWSDRGEKSKHEPQKSGLSADRGYLGHKAAKMMKRSKTLEARQQAAISEKSALLKNIETAEPLKIHPLPYKSQRLATVRDLSIRYGGRVACENVSFEICRGDRIALVGDNGCGKSSLLKILTGELQAASGTAEIGSRLLVSYVAQNTAHLEGSLREFAKTHEIGESLFKSILRKLDFSRTQLEKDMKDFSGGQKKKALIAKSLCQQAHLYIWDEPLNFIDLASRMQIEELILKHCPTMLFVEHDRAFVERIATKIVNL